MTDYIRRHPLLSAFLAFALLLTLLSSVAIVPETRQGIVVRPLGGFGLPHCVRVSSGTDEQTEWCIQAACPAWEAAREAA